MARKDFPDWMKADPEICPGCGQEVRIDAVFHRSGPNRGRYHECSPRWAFRSEQQETKLADTPPAGPDIVVCSLEGCDSARKANEQVWHYRGKSLALRHRNVVGREVCTKHSR